VGDRSGKFASCGNKLVVLVKQRGGEESYPLKDQDPRDEESA